MIRQIVDVPLPFARVVDIRWRVDWRGQPPSEGTDGNEQVVYNRLPRFVGAPTMVLPPEMIGEWRALISRGQGRINAYRMRMIDPVVSPQQYPGEDPWRAYQAGVYAEPRPQIPVRAAVSAGATSIAVDESGAWRPVRIGAILSYDDLPFVVEGRTGSGDTTVLSVSMLRTAIPASGQIDLIARGLFLATSDSMGWPEYGLDWVARPQLDLIEWITR